MTEVVECGREARHFGEIDEPSNPDRRRIIRRALFAAGALGTGLASRSLGNAVINVFADSGTDIQMLQTAASIENSAIAAYQKALTLPPAVSGASIPVIAAFGTKTVQQHTDH